MILRLTIDVPEDKHSVTLTRLLGKTTLQFMQVSPEVIGDVETILDELCSNVIRHARSERGRFVLKLEYHADRIVVTVKDRGKGFALADVREPGTLRPDFGGGERFGGFGLKIVGALADRLRFCRSDDRGTTVRAEKRLTYETQAAFDRAVGLSAGGGGGA